METNVPAVATCYPVGNTGLRALAERHNPESILSRDEIYLRDPYAPGAEIKRTNTSSLTFSLLANNEISDTLAVKDPESRSLRSQAKFNAMLQMAHTFWPVARSTFRRLAVMQKRDNGISQNITPDMGIVIQKPSRKIDKPKNNKITPPRPGGR